jgi:hypothetical protein
MLFLLSYAIEEEVNRKSKREIETPLCNFTSLIFLGEKGNYPIASLSTKLEHTDCRILG